MDTNQAPRPGFILTDADPGTLADHAFDLIGSCGGAQGAIAALLEEAGCELGLDDIVIKEVADNASALKIGYEWNRDGQKLLLNLERRFLRGVFETWYDNFKRNRHFVYLYDSRTDRNLLIHMIRTDLVKTVLQVPFYNENNEFQGCIEFTDYANNREWSDAQIESMKNLTKVIFSYLFEIREVDLSRATLGRLLKTDSITGLAKYESFVDECLKAAKDGREDKNSRGVRIAVVCADISNFKYINERYGYEKGDDILRLFSRCLYEYYTRMLSGCREYSDHFCFAIKLPAGIDNDHVNNNINGLAAYFISRVQEDIIDSNMTVNMGVFVMENGDIDVESALSNANVARKFAKKRFSSGYGRVALFDRDMVSGTAKELELIGKVDDAIINREFSMFLQPKVRCSDMQIVGAEALVRWKKPDGEFIYPDSFIPAFERDGCIVKVDYFMYEEVMKYLRGRLDHDLECVPVSVNVSRVHLYSRDLIQCIGHLMHKYRIPAGLLEFELTESIYIDDLPTLQYTIDKLKAMGTSISIDDFGSGYSSLDILTSLQADIIKLDRAFLSDKMTVNDKIIIGTIVDMARRLGLRVLCEGVENEEQRLFLEDIGCEFMQGYLFSKPIEVKDFDRLFQKNREEKT
ncbi:MAG: GGDEF domain-containing phosphodiesterase [Lachnospiraceae bacterium]|nr:GGDEF domain-containing phosphodiesterase [Lachnospiraceae bacterium]